MTTTAFDDQFTPSTQTIEPVRQPYSTEAILRRNIADMEVALRTQTERAEAAEAELANLAQQKPVAWCDPVEFKDDPWSFQGFRCRTSNYPTMPLYASPVPAPHKGATHCDDCGLTWLDDGLNPLGCPYCKDATPAPAVPAEWRAVMAELLANDGADGGRYDANKWLAARDKARALLQSSAQAPAVPAEIMALSKKYTIDTEAYHAAMDALLQSAGATK